MTLNWWFKINKIENVLNTMQNKPKMQLTFGFYYPKMHLKIMKNMINMRFITLLPKAPRAVPEGRPPISSRSLGSFWNLSWPMAPSGRFETESWSRPRWALLEWSNYTCKERSSADLLDSFQNVTQWPRWAISEPIMIYGLVGPYLDAYGTPAIRSQ